MTNKPNSLPKWVERAFIILSVIGIGAMIFYCGQLYGHISTVNEWLPKLEQKYKDSIDRKYEPVQETLYRLKSDI